LLFQSTRPRGARPFHYRQYNAMLVSIHAPAGGATEKIYLPSVRLCFNPRARGGRDRFIMRKLSTGSFQSTRPRGARLKKFTCRVLDYVSIHAPAGGATSRLGKRVSRLSFNPRARGGRDLSIGIHADTLLFQSTRPRGARPRLPHKGIIPQVSIHAPAGGATL